MKLIEKNSDGKLVLFKNRYSGEVNKETLDKFVKEYSSFKTYDAYIECYNKLRSMDIDTLISVAPDFGRLYNEPEFIRLLNDYLKME